METHKWQLILFELELAWAFDYQTELVTDDHSSLEGPLLQEHNKIIIIGQSSAQSRAHKGRWQTIKDITTYPWLWGMDLKSTYKSIWLGWWLITFRTDPFSEFDISFQPGL